MVCIKKKIDPTFTNYLPLYPMEENNQILYADKFETYTKFELKSELSIFGVPRSEIYVSNVE